MVKTKLVPSLVLATALCFGMTAAPAEAQLNLGSGVVINDIDLDPADLELVDGVLQLAEGATATVTGTIAGLPFTTTITDFALELIPDGGGAGEACSILHLELAPIDLNLLGLFVDTSPICLDITAMEGGGLLGDLLCSIAGGNLLDLGDLLGTGPGNLADGLTDILNAGLGQAATGSAAHQVPGAEEICDGDLEILDLAVGPVELDLLGLVVELDDCTGGPVQVCVSASRGQGLLGDLLVGLLGGGGPLGGLLGDNLALIEDLLGGLLGGGTGPLTGLNVPAKTVNQLVDEVGRVLRDGNVTASEADRLSKRVEKIARKS